jgi:nucleoside-triphosphatase
MMAATRRHAAKVVIEGRPGSGKTTVAARVVELLHDAGIEVAGFLTRELREGGSRVGFEIESFDGERAILAHLELEGPPRVGRYGVDLEAFEGIALPAITDPGDAVVVIDELGKMELASERFRELAGRLIDQEIRLVATIHAHRHPFTDRVKRRADVELLRVTRQGRDALPEQIVGRVGFEQRR